MRRTRLTTALPVLLGLTLLGPWGPAGAVIGGTPAAPGQVAGMALVLSGDGAATCGGTLVSSTKVVTAAHCTVSSGDLTVVLDLTDLSQFPAQGEPHSVTDFVRHPLWQPEDVEYDVAVLTLDEPTGVEPVRVVRPDEGSLWAAGVEGTIAGWGVTSADNDATDQLRLAQVVVGPAGECPSSTIFCAGDGSPGACAGDSGGPLLVDGTGDEQVLAGVVIGGSSVCGDPPNFYAKVGADPLNGWLTDQIGADTNAPRVVLHSPTGTGVKRSAVVRAGFSEPVAEASVGADTLRLSRVTKDGLQRVRDVHVTLSADGTVARLDPDRRLRAGATYRAQVTTAVRDLAGNRLDQDAARDGRQPEAWTFTTAR